MPQTHPPAAEAEVDFHDLWVREESSRFVDDDGPGVLGSCLGPRRCAVSVSPICPQVAHRGLMLSVEHRRSRYLNNRAENSHQPTRQRERAMKRFKSSRHAQRFLSAFSGISAHFRPRRHLLSATEWRTEMADRFAVWRQVTAPDAAA